MLACVAAASPGACTDDARNERAHDAQPAADAANPADAVNPADAGPPLDAAGDARTEEGGASTASRPPLYEQLECDLPAVLSYCGGSSCHYDDASPEVGSSLALWNRAEQRVVEGLEASLLGAGAQYRNVLSGECPSTPELLVDPEDVERSLLLKKLLGTHACGDEMPKFPYPEWGTVDNPAPAREEFVACMRAWLTLLVEDFNESR